MVSTDKMPLATHEFALMDMMFSNEEAFLAKTQPGYETVKYVFFPGCQASAIAPGTVEAAYLDLMERLDGGVGLMLGCCGAIADWAGRFEMLEETKELLKQELAKMGNPIIIADSGRNRSPGKCAGAYLSDRYSRFLWSQRQ